MIPELRPYQLEIRAAVLNSVFGHRGLTFSVEIARQGGKNELSAQLELFLLTRNMTEPLDLVKCSPTFKPQTIISMTRLKDRLNGAGISALWTAEQGYIVRLGNARAIFLSADDTSNVVGHTAHLLLEIDEAQDVGIEKYTKDFKPMGATTNVTTVLYGTTWDDSTLLERTKQTNLELERKDGIRRHFRYDWQEVAGYNPDYQAYVEGERERLGENHPLFLTQYRLLPVRGGGGFLSAQQRAQLQGEHARRHTPPSREHLYVAGIDLAGEAEELEGEYLTSLRTRRDSTVVTIGEIEIAGDAGTPSLRLSSTRGESAAFRPSPPVAQPPLPRWERVGSEGVHSTRPGFELLLPKQPGIKIVEHYAWTGKRHTGLYAQLIDILKNVWHCRKVVVDATGVGQPVSSFLQEALGNVIVPFVFTAPSKSQLGFNLLSAVNSGCLKMYSSDGSAEFQEFWTEIEKAKSYYRPSQTMNFYVDPSQGHDDFLMSLALLVEAANRYEPRVARGK